MKVLHLLTWDLRGGATLGAYWLHQALRGIGIDSVVLTNDKGDLEDPSVMSLADSGIHKLRLAISRRIAGAPVGLYRGRRRLIFNTGLDGIDFTRHPAYRSADLIHLHWVNGLVSVGALRRIDKPVVWTLRDMWPFTGGCHYSLDCERFQAGCGRCPQLGSKREHDLTRLVLRNKQRSLPTNTRIVGISHWLSDCAKRSVMFRKASVTTISNNVDTELFSPVEKRLARQALGLKDTDRIVLIGAQNISAFYKGFELFLEALPRLTTIRGELHVVSFGRSDGVSEVPGIRMTSLGYLSDAADLRQAYSAADVFVAPSRMDAFGKTLAEAMSCATPVVCFDATGPKDIVEHRVTGYKAVPFEPSDLANGIRWVLDQPADSYAEMCRNARLRAQQRFDTRVIARQYHDLYRYTLDGESG